MLTSSSTNCSRNKVWNYNGYKSKTDFISITYIVLAHIAVKLYCMVRVNPPGWGARGGGGGRGEGGLATQLGTDA